MKRKALNPVVIILNRNFSEVSEAIMFATVTKTDTNIFFNLIEDIKGVCQLVKDVPEDMELSVYVKQPFTNCFVSAKRIVSTAMKFYFPEDIKTSEDVEDIEEIISENVDEVQTETVTELEGVIITPVISETIAVVEEAPKRRKTKKTDK